MEPNREPTIVGAAFLAAQAGQPEDAASYWRRAIAKSPYRSDYHAELAALCFQTRDWRAASDACRAALRLNPTDVGTRMLLVRTYLRLKNPQAARDEFETLLGFDLPDRDDLLRRFAALAPHR